MLIAALLLQTPNVSAKNSEGDMGIFDKKEGSIFGDKPDDDRTTRKPADFSDASSGSPPPASSGARADFSDVSTGESTQAPASGQGGQSYTVKSGDSLSKIAKQVYGDASAWKRIYEANRDTIKDPDMIHPGQKFTIPDA